jgi:hypothetical protein
MEAAPMPVRVPRLRTRLAALVAGLAVAGAACSSGEAVRPSSGAEDLPKDATDRAIVESGVLRITDFPAGWSTDLKSAAPGSDEDESTEDIPECARLEERNDALTLGKADSPSFVTLTGARVRNNVEIYPDAGAAGAMQALVSGSDSIGCLRQGLTDMLSEELRSDPEIAPLLGDVTVDGGPTETGDYGDATDALGFEAAADVGGQELHLFFRVVVVRVGRAQASYVFMDDVPDPWSDVQPQVIDASVGRLRAAGA